MNEIRAFGSSLDRGHEIDMMPGARRRWRYGSRPSTRSRGRRSIERRHGASARSSRFRSLGFLLANPSVATGIPGTRTVEQMLSSLAAARPLPEATMTAIRAWHAERLADDPLAW